MGVRGIMVIGLATLLLVAGSVAAFIAIEAMRAESIGRVTLERSRYLHLWARLVAHQSNKTQSNTNLLAVVERGRPPEVKKLILVDKTLHLIGQHPSQTVAKDPIILDAFSQSQAHALTEGDNGQTTQRFAQRLKLSDGRSLVLWAEFNMDELTKSLARREKVVIGYLIFAFVAVLIFGLYLSRRLLVTPLQELTQAANRIDSETLDIGQVISIGGPKELRHLGLALGRLIGRLADKNLELTESLNALSRAQSDLVQAEKLATVGRLSAGVAHEVGNPLAAIMGFLEYLQKEPHQSQLTGELYSRMDRELKRIQTTVRNLLDYSRPSSGTRERVDLKHLILDAVELIRFHPKMVGIHMNVEGESHEVFVERQRVTQVLTNLLLNASDAMGAQGTIKLILSDQKERVIIDVCDSGHGVHDEDVEHIFEPFWSTKRLGSGTGLGLSVSRRLIEDEGGQLILLSSSQSGAVFRIYLPKV